MNVQAKMGDNNPPDPIDEALAPFGDAISEAENWLDGEPVTNEDQMKAVDAVLKDIKEALKAVKAGEESEAKPIYDRWKATKARWKPTIDDLDRIKKGLAACTDAFKKKLADAKREAERKAWLEAEEKRKQAEAAARAADEADIDAQREAAAKIQEAQDAQKQASAASRDTVKGMRTVHKHEITDLRAALHWIAREDKEAISAFVEEYVRKNFRDHSIDGVRAWTEKEAF